MSETKVIIFVVSILLAGLVVGRVSEVASSPVKIVDKLFSCKGSDCSYTVEIKNRSFQELDGVLNIETYATVKKNGVSETLLDNLAEKSFRIEPSEVKVLEGEFTSLRHPNSLMVDVATVNEVN